MKKVLSLITLQSLLLLGCQQEDNKEIQNVSYTHQRESIKQEDVHAYSELLPKGMMEKYIALQFKDSGLYVNKLKKGFWVEYSIDSSLNGSEVQGMPLVKGGTMNLACTVMRDEGNYETGKENGVWKRFSTLDNRFPFRWDLTYETEYKNGLKDGNEVLYDHGDFIKITSYKKDKILSKKTIHEPDPFKAFKKEKH